ncbi:hypothetical protein KRX54_02690 [Actinomycetaceae bacterium TAE3-ERU4]|nr:hypothetical protein [Actinomycetaceae bacterium TAE3-ERU4]
MSEIENEVLPPEDGNRKKESLENEVWQYLRKKTEKWSHDYLSRFNIFLNTEITLSFFCVLLIGIISLLLSYIYKGGEGEETPFHQILNLFKQLCSHIDVGVFLAIAATLFVAVALGNNKILPWKKIKEIEEIRLKSLYILAARRISIVVLAISMWMVILALIISYRYTEPKHAYSIFFTSFFLSSPFLLLFMLLSFPILVNIEMNFRELFSYYSKKLKKELCDKTTDDYRTEFPEILSKSQKVEEDKEKNKVSDIQPFVKEKPFPCSYLTSGWYYFVIFFVPAFATLIFWYFSYQHIQHIQHIQHNIQHIQHNIQHIQHNIQQNIQHIQHNIQQNIQHIQQNIQHIQQNIQHIQQTQCIAYFVLSALALALWLHFKVEHIFGSKIMDEFSSLDFRIREKISDIYSLRLRSFYKFISSCVVWIVNFYAFSSISDINIWYLLVIISFSVCLALWCLGKFLECCLKDKDQYKYLLKLNLDLKPNPDAKGESCEEKAFYAEVYRQYLLVLDGDIRKISNGGKYLAYNLDRGKCQVDVTLNQSGKGKSTKPYLFISREAAKFAEEKVGREKEQSIKEKLAKLKTRLCEGLCFEKRS